MIQKYLNIFLVYLHNYIKIQHYVILLYWISMGGGRGGIGYSFFAQF